MHTPADELAAQIMALHLEHLDKGPAELAREIGGISKQTVKRILRKHAPVEADLATGSKTAKENALLGVLRFLAAQLGSTVESLLSMFAEEIALCDSLAQVSVLVCMQSKTEIVLCVHVSFVRVLNLIASAYAISPCAGVANLLLQFSVSCVCGSVSASSSVLTLALTVQSRVGMSRQSYTTQRMQAVAERSKADYLRTRPADEAALLGDVSCEYAGVAQADGTYDLQAPIRANSKVAFRWRVVSDGPQSMLVEGLGFTYHKYRG